MSGEPPLFRLTHVYKRFGPQVALRDVSVALGPREVVAVLGPNGAGKTTLLRTLATLARPTRGSVEAFGIEAWTAKTAVRLRIGVVGHQPYLYPELTCVENLAFFGTLYGLEDAHARSIAVLERVGLASRGMDRAGTLSRGLLQRLSLARAILHDPPVLILDEPDTGLDVAGRRVLTEIIRSQADREGSVVFTTHAIDYALQLATRVLVLVDGRLVLEEARDSVDLGLVEAAVGSATAVVT